ncbi:hypothetical protein ACFX1W_004815 [Malus domestica]
MHTRPKYIKRVSPVVDSGYSDMDIIRALDMANNDVTAAINLIFDTPSFKLKERPPAFRKNPQILSSEVVNLKQIGGQKSIALWVPKEMGVVVPVIQGTTWLKKSRLHGARARLGASGGLWAAVKFQVYQRVKVGGLGLETTWILLSSTSPSHSLL